MKLLAWETEAVAVSNRGRGSKLWMKQKIRVRSKIPKMGLAEERPDNCVMIEKDHPFGGASLLEGAGPSSGQ